MPLAHRPVLFGPKCLKTKEFEAHVSGFVGFLCLSKQTNRVQDRRLARNFTEIGYRYACEFLVTKRLNRCAGRRVAAESNGTCVAIGSSVEALPSPEATFCVRAFLFRVTVCVHAVEQAQLEANCACPTLVLVTVFVRTHGTGAKVEFFVQGDWVANGVTFYVRE